MKKKKTKERKYKFEAYDVIYLGLGDIRIHASIKDKKLLEELEKEGGKIGVRLPREGWKVELVTEGEIKVRKKRHKCDKEHYRKIGEEEGETEIICLRCGYRWKTSARYVEDIREMTEEDEVNEHFMYVIRDNYEIVIKKE